MRRLLEILFGLLKKVAIPLAGLLMFLIGNTARTKRIEDDKAAQSKDQVKKKNRRQGRHRR